MAKAEAKAEVPVDGAANGAANGRNATSYVVLEKSRLTGVEGNAGEVAWAVVGRTDSPTKQGAVQRVVGDREGTFKAVPERSWTGSVRTKVEQITRTKAEVLEADE